MALLQIEDSQNSIELYYEDMGGGIPIVLIHGWLCNGHFWEDFHNLTEDGYRLVIPDLRGHGNTPLGKKLSIERLAEDINELLIHLNIEKAIIIGHSMGGIVAQAFYHSYPEKVIALGLWNTGGQIPFGNGLSLIPFYTTIIFAGIGMLLAYPIPGLFSYSLTKGWAFSFHKKWKSEAYKKLAPHVRSMKKSAALKSASAFRKFKGIEKLSEIKVPTMLLHGEADKFITPKKLFLNLDKYIPKTYPYIIEKAGHFPPNERPDEVYEKLMEFLNSIK